MVLHRIHATYSALVIRDAVAKMPPSPTIVSTWPSPVNDANLSSSFSLEAEEARDTPAVTPRISPGTTSSLRCTVNEFFPRLPNPNLLFRPVTVPLLTYYIIFIIPFVACAIILGACGNYGIVQVGSTVHLWRKAATWSCSFCPFQGRSSRVARPSAARRHSLAPIRCHRQALCHSGCRLYNSDMLIV